MTTIIRMESSPGWTPDSVRSTTCTCSPCGHAPSSHEADAAAPCSEGKKLSLPGDWAGTGYPLCRHSTTPAADTMKQSVLNWMQHSWRSKYSRSLAVREGTTNPQSSESRLSPHPLLPSPPLPSSSLADTSRFRKRYTGPVYTHQNYSEYCSDLVYVGLARTEIRWKRCKLNSNKKMQTLSAHRNIPQDLQQVRSSWKSRGIAQQIVPE